MPIHVLILNYNGRDLLAECLPSILLAAARSRHEVRLAVVDNDSTDDSREFLGRRFPQVRVIRRPNRGLCSFNDALRNLDGRVAVLLNNDIKLAPACLDPLVDPLLGPPPAGERPLFMTAPCCRLFDGETYEGFKTAVRWRWGLVQATALFPGHDSVVDRPDDTASSGAVMAVDRGVFLHLGGFDPRYLPGRLEDLDFCFRAWRAGYRARYVPESRAYHRGAATFGREFGAAGCDLLALRNTLLFQWKNLRHPAHVARQIAGLPLRVVRDVVVSPWRQHDERFAFCRALIGALSRLREIGGDGCDAESQVSRHTGGSRAEAEFFERFSPEAIHPRLRRCHPTDPVMSTNIPATLTRNASDERRVVPRSRCGFVCAEANAWQQDERRRGARHPISRWYLLPLALWLAERLARSRVRPAHVTLMNLALAACAGALIVGHPSEATSDHSRLSLRERTSVSNNATSGEQTSTLKYPIASAWAAAFVLAAWFCDRLDGPLARRQGRSSAWGAWLDGNVDELIDVGLHVAVCAAVAPSSAFAWPLLVGFLCGKYLFLHGLAGLNQDRSPDEQAPLETDSILRRLWQLPGNADVRVHVLIAALLTGCLTAELAFVAVYYNLRWLVRYPLVWRRLARGAA